MNRSNLHKLLHTRSNFPHHIRSKPYTVTLPLSLPSASDATATATVTTAPQPSPPLPPSLSLSLRNPFDLKLRNPHSQSIAQICTAKKGLYSLGMLVWVLDYALIIRNLPQATKLGTCCVMETRFGECPHT
ncbi:unnamed protein product [Camellia sinensis]